MTQGAITRGIHHIGLTMGRQEASVAFFTEVLGWQEVRRDPGYPAIFVTDGVVMVTLWGPTPTPIASTSTTMLACTTSPSPCPAARSWKTFTHGFMRPKTSVSNSPRSYCVAARQCT